MTVGRTTMHDLNHWEHLEADAVLAAAVRLADGGPLVVYQAGTTTRHAIGARAELRLSAELLTTSWSEPVTGPVLGDVAAALDACPFPLWRAFGWARFELALHRAGMPTGLPGTEPLLHLVLPEVELVTGSAEGPVTVLASSPQRAAEARAVLSAAVPAVPAATGESTTAADLLAGAHAYRDAVAQAVDDIRKTLLDKVILSREVPLAGNPDLVGTFRRGRAAVASARAFHLDLGGWAATGFSPETVVEVGADGRVSTQPLAGTRALGLGRARDEANRAELLSDLKEIAEHATSVRLAVEEAEALCAPGTVRVEEFMRVLPRGAVQHLASRVAGELAAGRGPWDAFGAFFPAVTASGIPKAEAYEALTRLESTPRGLYSGAVIVADHTGALDAALVLRTVFTHEGRSWLRAGAGVVEASRPDRELEETCEKLGSVAPHLTY
ncbi:salicylate synthase [Kineosporia sp. J2-2]|uniref:Salicylate synthase n=1 Tax=Kineosporia corallincola TaxID=2835133 RepID=A0ABS5TT63_9ACTN|nr:salicylate synthase [Kineosporia corallincola]MBT0774012.1 salicylate synthase [Kineosporia corallincola]